MIFLFVIPMMAAFGNYMVPLQIGARDMAFPRLNAMSFWLLLFGGIVLYSSFLFGSAPESGWTSYPPLSVLDPGLGQDFWIVGLHIVGLSSIIGAINFICTIHNMRAPGMRLSRMPLFTWTIDIYSIMIMASAPVFAGALTMLLLDRNFGTNFYDPERRQRAAVPAPVLVLLAPGGLRDGAARIRHDLRDPAGVLAQAAVRLQGAGLLGRGDRLPRLPGVGPPHVRRRSSRRRSQIWFMIASMAIAVPTGVKIFNWVGTMWMGRIRFEPPMLFAVGFIGLFMIGGLSGIFLAAFPIDL